MPTTSGDFSRLVFAPEVHPGKGTIARAPLLPAQEPRSIRVRSPRRRMAVDAIALVLLLLSTLPIRVGGSFGILALVLFLLLLFGAWLVWMLGLDEMARSSSAHRPLRDAVVLDPSSNLPPGYRAVPAEPSVVVDGRRLPLAGVRVIVAHWNWRGRYDTNNSYSINLVFPAIAYELDRGADRALAFGLAAQVAATLALAEPADVVEHRPFSTFWVEEQARPMGAPAARWLAGAGGPLAMTGFLWTLAAGYVAILGTPFPADDLVLRLVPFAVFPMVLRWPAAAMLRESAEKVGAALLGLAPIRSMPAPNPDAPLKQRSEHEMSRMVSKEEAMKYVTNYLEDSYKSLPGGVVLLLDHTIEKPYGWVFFHQSRKFLETHDINHMLVGNSPILVEAQSGRVTFLGTSLSAEQSLRRLEDSGIFGGQASG